MPDSFVLLLALTALVVRAFWAVGIELSCGILPRKAFQPALSCAFLAGLVNLGIVVCQEFLRRNFLIGSTPLCTLFARSLAMNFTFGFLKNSFLWVLTS